MAKKKAKKPKTPKIDGISADDIKRIRQAIRQVWCWSHPWRLTKARAIGKDGFPRCEKCKKKVPKVFIDHIQNVGDVDEGFIKRLFVPSSHLQALCKKCHDAKTKLERAEMKLVQEIVSSVDDEDFY